jgi:CRISPR-associated protein Csx10
VIYISRFLMTLNLEIKLLSDALFGAGYGKAGEVDIEPELDAETGLPIIRGRTLKGLLVEAAADILYAARSAGSPGGARLEEAARKLFGRPGSELAARGDLRIGAAKLPAGVEESLRASLSGNAGKVTRDDVVESLTTIRRQTAIDDERGAPKDGSLRSARVVSRDLVLTAPVSLESDDEDSVALLAACASMVRRGGSNRTRGMGKIAVRLAEAELQQRAISRFEAILRGQEGASLGLPSSQAVPRPEGSTGTKPVTLRYRLHLEEPVLVTGLEGDPNSSVGLDYIPGTTLRGAFVGRYLRGRSGVDLAADPEARKLFFEGGIRFLNAVPVARETTMPTPRSLHHPKGSDGTISDFAVAPHLETADTDTQWKAFRVPYVVVADGAIQPFSPERNVALHIRRSRRTRVDATDDRAVFTYDSLAAGQIFEGALECANGEAAAIARSWLEGHLRVGGTSSAGYGYCRIEFVDAIDVDGGGEVGNEDESVLVLESPLILRDQVTGLLSTDVNVLQTELQRALGKDVRIEKERCFLSETLLGGFNRKWGLPLPQIRAIDAGSVIVLTGLSSTRIDPIGERTLEGFGRLRVMKSGRAEYQKIEASAAPQPVRPDELEESSRKVLDQIARRTLERRIEGLLLQKALDLSRSGSKPPNRSQIARVRQAFRDALQSIDAPSPDAANQAQEKLSRFLKDLRQPSEKQLRKYRLSGSGRLLDWLYDRANGTEDLHSLIGLTHDHRPRLYGDNLEVTAKVTRYANWKLAFATLTLIAKSKADG